MDPVRDSGVLNNSLKSRMPVPQDISWLGSVVLPWPSTRRWNLGGLTPTPESMSDLLWGGVAHAQVLEIVDSSHPCCLFQLCDLDLYNGTAHMDLLVHPDGGSEIARELAVIVARSFGLFPLRKIYVRVAAGTAGFIEGLLPKAILEARLILAVRSPSGLFEDELIFCIEGPRSEMDVVS